MSALGSWLRRRIGSRRTPLAFSIRVREGGFTDQLLQFSTLYKLGVDMGMAYRHEPFSSERTGTGRGVYEFLGFDSVFDNAAPLVVDESGPVIPVDLGDELLRGRSVRTLEDIKHYVMARVDREMRRRGFPSRTGLRGPGAVSDVHAAIVRLGLAEGQSRGFFSLVNEAIPDFPDDVDLYEGYRTERLRAPVESRFDEERVRLLVHARQGDTAVVPTPWRYSIALWGRKPPVVYAQGEEPGAKYVSASVYAEFLKALFEVFDPLGFSLVCSSDGYQRAASVIRENAGYLKLGEPELRQIQAVCKRLDGAIFDPIPRSARCEILVGESDRNLFDLIDCALNADVIICGTQQRMLPKLLSLYGSPRHQPLFIVLSRTGKVQDYGRKIGLTSRKAKVCCVDVSLPREEWVTPEIESAIRERVAARGAD